MFIGFSDIVDSKPCNYHCLYQYCNVLPHISATIFVAQLTITVFLCTHVSQAASMCITLICDCLHLQWGLGLCVFPGFTWIMVTLCKPSSLKTNPPVQLLYNLKYCFSQEAISPFLLLCPMSSCNKENKGEGPDIPPVSITVSRSHERKSEEMLNVVLQTFIGCHQAFLGSFDTILKCSRNKQHGFSYWVAFLPLHLLIRVQSITTGYVSSEK